MAAGLGVSPRQPDGRRHGRGPGAPLRPGPAAAAAPPPLPGQGPTFHVEIGGAASGPFTVAQVQAGVAGGQVQPTSLVWAAGMAGWAPAQTVPALQGLFTTPPPLPPAPPAGGAGPPAPGRPCAPGGPRPPPA